MRLTLGIVVLVAASLGGMGSARAYPVFQYASGSDRCSDCHYSPTGGGQLNPFGRSEAGDAVSLTGDGQFLHGAWTPPAALALGADIRVAGAGIVRKNDEDQIAVFPMQADLHMRLEGGPVSLNVTGGLNGSARDRPDGASLASYLVSREHYVMYQQAPGTPYVRLGRFFPTIGIRTADHSALARRALDQYTLEEPYALGGGLSGDAWELHASLFAPNPFGAGPDAYGGTVSYERFFSGHTSLAAQTRVARTSDDTRSLLGVVAKKWISAAKLLLLGELDAQLQTFAGADFSRLQVLGYAGINYVRLPGFVIGLVAQRWDPDLMFGGTARTTTELNVQLFPLAHFELHVLARAGWSGNVGETPDGVGLVQIHYYP